MKSTGHLVSPTAEFSTSVKDCEYNFHTSKSGFVVYVYWDTSTIIFYNNGIVFVNSNFDMITKTSKRLIYRVINNLIHKMMQSSACCCSDIHTRSFSDCFKSFKNLNLVSAILYFFVTHYLLHFLVFTIYCSFSYFEQFIYFKSVINKFIKSGTCDNCLNISYCVKKVILSIAIKL